MISAKLCARKLKLEEHRRLRSGWFRNGGCKHHGSVNKTLVVYSLLVFLCGCPIVPAQMSIEVILQV